MTRLNSFEENDFRAFKSINQKINSNIQNTDVQQNQLKTTSQTNEYQTKSIKKFKS